MITDCGVVDGVCELFATGLFLDLKLKECEFSIGKYGQLGLGADRLNDNYLFVQVDSTEFRDKQIVDCLCGRWNTFLILNK